MTAPTYSNLAILNRALTMVGAATVDSLTDGSNNANVLNDIYELCLRSLLSEGKWSFATTRTSLAVTTTALAWYDSGNTCVYTIPTDLIRIFDTSDSDATWRIEAGNLITDTTGLGIRYVYYVDDVTKFPAKFLDAFTDKLCSEIAYQIVNSASLGEAFIKKYETTSLPKALSEDAQQGAHQDLKDDAWELAKYSDTQANT